MPQVAVVTDSTSDLDPVEAGERGLRVVPMTVAFGDESFVSRITISDEQFYDRLGRTDQLPTTSQPVPAWFEEAYGDAADDGADAIVSIHLSSELSGTVGQARTVAESQPLPVHVVDTRQVGGGLALAALAAHGVAEQGGSVEEVVAAAERVAATATTLYVVDTLEYLKKGGRLSSTQALVGNVLRVKPILGMAAGSIEVVERTRTWSRALDRLVELTVTAVGDATVDMVVSHGLAPERAAAAEEALRGRIDVHDLVRTRVGPVMGTHAGPGSLGVAVVPIETSAIHS